VIRFFTTETSSHYTAEVTCLLFEVLTEGLDLQNWPFYIEPYRPSQKNARNSTSAISLNFVLDHNSSIFESSNEGTFVRCASCMCGSLVSPIPSSHATHTHTHTDTCTILSPPIHSLFITPLFIFLETVVVNKFPLLPLPLLLD
jgi:hypothetical protein